MYQASYDDGTVFATMMVFLVVQVGVLLVVILTTCLLSAWSLTVLFRKTGVETWKAWVPIYQTVTWLRLGGQNGIWGWLSLIPYFGIVTSVFVYIGMYKTNIAFRKDIGLFILGIFFPFVWAFVIGYGKAPYEPYLIAYQGFKPPLEGYGSYDPARQQPTM